MYSTEQEIDLNGLAAGSFSHFLIVLNNFYNNEWLLWPGMLSCIILERKFVVFFIFFFHAIEKCFEERIYF